MHCFKHRRQIVESGEKRGVASMTLGALGYATVCLRFALAAAFLTAVTDRLGILSFQTRRAAQLGGWLLLAFGNGMRAGTGIKSALNASVFFASAGAFLLATTPEYPLSIVLRQIGNVTLLTMLHKRATEEYVHRVAGFEGQASKSVMADKRSQMWMLR